MKSKHVRSVFWGILITVCLGTSAKAEKDEKIKEARAYAAPLYIFDSVFNKDDSECIKLVTGFTEKIKSIIGRDSETYQRVMILGLKVIADINSGVVTEGEYTTPDGIIIRLDKKTAEELNEARRTARSEMEKIKLIPINKLTCENYLKIIDGFVKEK